MNREIIDKQIDSAHQYNGSTENHKILLAQLRVLLSPGIGTILPPEFIRCNSFFVSKKQIYEKKKREIANEKNRVSGKSE